MVWKNLCMRLSLADDRGGKCTSVTVCGRAVRHRHRRSDPLVLALLRAEADFRKICRHWSRGMSWHEVAVRTRVGSRSMVNQADKVRRLYSSMVSSMRRLPARQALDQECRRIALLAANSKASVGGVSLLWPREMMTIPLLQPGRGGRRFRHTSSHLAHVETPMCPDSAIHSIDDQGHK
jgi:hypothetical protein